MESFHWEVDLQGPANVLHVLARDFTTGPVRVSVDEAQRRHALCMDSFANCGTDEEVSAQTSAYLPALSGALALTLGTAPDLKMGAILKKHDDGHTDYFVAVGGQALHAEAGFVAVVTDHDGQPVERPQPPSPAVKMAGLALSNRKRPPSTA